MIEIIIFLVVGFYAVMILGGIAVIVLMFLANLLLSIFEFFGDGDHEHTT